MVYTRLFRTFNGWKQLSHVKCFHGEATKHKLVQKAEAKVKRFGQRTPATHPHLLKPGEVTSGITLYEYQIRRHRLIESIARMGRGIEHHIVVIPSASKSYLSHDLPCLFHQNTDFLYTCGFQEPNSVLVLLSTTETLPVHHSVMFVEKRTPFSKLWNGPFTGPDGAVELLGVDESFPIGHFQEFLMKFMRAKKNIALWYDNNLTLNPSWLNEVMKVISYNLSTTQVQPLIQELKLRKSPAEISLMLHSNMIASEAFIKTMKSTRAGSTEHNLSAKMEYECKVRGANYVGYTPVVAGGNRATIMHYIQNQSLSKGELVLMGAGCYRHGYVGNIARTWPVDGEFTVHQKILYEAVLEVQLLLLAELNERRCSLDQLEALHRKSLGIKLQEIGVIPKSVPRTSLASIAAKFCPRTIGRYRGMDVHDCSSIPRDVKSEPGTAIAIESGIYINENNRKVPAEFRGMGIHIEDTVVITHSGYLNLTRTCPKQPQELESLMSGHKF